MKPYLVQHLLDLTAARYPDNVAVKHGQDTVTFEQLHAQSGALAGGLHALGRGKGQRIGILLDKSIAQVAAMLGVLRADGIFVLINSILKESQIRHILKDCGINLLIVAEKYRSRIQNVIGDTEVETLITESELDEMTRSYAGQDGPNAATGEDIASIIYTSGSTGLPKGIVITHRNLIDGARIVSHYLGITPAERILGLLPLNFDYGLNQLLSTLHTGCTLVLFQFFMPSSLLKILIDEKITGLPAIPTIWSAVFNPQMCKIDPARQYPDLRYISNTGGKLPVPTVKNIRRLFPAAKLFLMYGLTEAFRSTYLDPAEVDQRPDSIGKAIPNVWVEVVDEQGRICRAGEVGELIHGGACVTRGYWNNPALTARSFRPNPLLPPPNQFLDRVVYSGDLVKKDDQGFLYYVGRKDAMIKKEGYRVSPTEVEELLTAHPDVYEAVVCRLEVESAKTGILALITARPGIDIGELIKFCRRRAPEYLVPDRIMVMDRFDRTETGKINRTRAIEEAYAKFDR